MIIRDLFFVFLLISSLQAVEVVVDKSYF